MDNQNENCKSILLRSGKEIPSGSGLNKEALEQMSSNVKFMKDILSKKRHIGEYKTMALTEEFSVILHHKLPPKLKDPSSFNITYSIRVNFSTKLRLGEVMPTLVTLQLADRTLACPKDVMENVIVKVEKFYYPGNFIILDMEEDRDVSLILERPFLTIGRALIDVKKGELAMRVENEHVTFKVFSALNLMQVQEECSSV
ncbi:Retrovirus-related Pol polyprotein from transposon opus [Gossypium australe]|uniref:Retrovirus-related Pol polyprotein from transposon opus n=1 Tax=Gossypium australe TaxID=47621 RepID=A0A5B6V1R9_9ROSI|nr:Retrovirus-related Pol polyprotein from transposon opus [Gossypium australe]